MRRFAPATSTSRGLRASIAALSRRTDPLFGPLATGPVVGRESIRGSRHKFIHRRFIRGGILEIEVVPLMATAGEDCLSIKNTIVRRVTRNNAPAVAPALVSDPVACACSPATKTRGHRTFDWSCVKRKPSVFTRRFSPPFIALGRKQVPILGYDGWKIIAALLRLSRYSKQHQCENN